MNTKKHSLSYLFSLSFILFSFQVLGQIKSAEKLELSSVPEKNLNKITSLAEKLIVGMDEKNYYKPTYAEASESLVELLTPEAQQKFYESKREGMGNFGGNIRVIEAYIVKYNNKEPMIFYRLKCDFIHDKTKHQLEGEIRMIYYKDKELLEAFDIYPWLSIPVGLQDVL